MHFKIGLFFAATLIGLIGCSNDSHPTPPDSEIGAAIAQSDDYSTNQQALITASKHLIKNGTCTLDDLKYMGGWVKSPNYEPEQIYLTYCGKMDVSHRIYLDVSNGRIFK